MEIKVHRGTHQIGGSIVAIKTAQARLIIDIGAELPSANKSELSFDIDGVTTGTATCDAILVTHYHGDHVGMFEKVLPEVPIYMGSTAKKILSVVQTTIKKKLDKGNPELIKTFKEFEADKPFHIKDIKITPYCIDHSAFDAYMFLIETEGKRILHTGDFRMHGARGRKMSAVFKAFAKDIDLLIIEGTMLSRMGEKAMTEHELGQEANILLRENKNVFVLCSSTNIDTIAEFYHAATKNKKPFIVCEDDFQNEILRIVTENSKGKTSYYDFTKPKVYNYGEQLHKFMTDKGFCFIGRTNFITKKAMSFFKDNLLVYSMWKGYLDKKHPAFDEYKSDWIDKAKTNCSKIVDLHTSGHATAEQIKQVCEITNAKMILPIHSENPKAFLELGINADIKILQDGEEIKL